MSKFIIYSKDGKTIRYSGYPKYNGTYMNVSYLDFGPVSVPDVINWEIGDYVDYTRTGKRYRLYSLPQIKKQARRHSCGDAIVYNSLLFHAKTHDLSIAPFRDYVKNDNGIHFSTKPTVSTYENVYGIVERIQQNLDNYYPGEWDVRVYDKLDEEFINKITESQDFAIEGNCLDACNRMYDLWGIGWLHIIENGKDVLLFGRPNKRGSDNTSELFVYGKGNGLTAIQRVASNPEDLATRLYVHGSSRNMPLRYYNKKNIKDADSVDIQHLMIPLEFWGKTDGLPDASKAYFEEISSVNKYGLIPKFIYFDGANYPEIFPTIKNVTIKDIREILSPESLYYPDTKIYDGSERVDSVKDVVNPKDENNDTELEIFKVVSPAVKHERFQSSDIYEYYLYRDIKVKNSGTLKFLSTQKGEIWSLKINNIRAHCVVKDAATDVVVWENYISVPIKSNSSDKCEFDLSEIDLSCIIPDHVAASSFKCESSITIIPRNTFPVSMGFISINGQEYTANLIREAQPDFKLYVRQLGFDVNEMTSLAKEGKCTVAFNTGMCAGRQFPVKYAKYRKETDDWEFGMMRQRDESLNEMFPNSKYPIKTGDVFVLLDIAMPETYISLASQKLYREAQKIYGDLSKDNPYYEPNIDAVVMANSARTLSEGMYMYIRDEDIINNPGGDDYVIIDTLTISEGEANIPTYKVSLRKQKRKSFQQTTKEAISDLKDKTDFIQAGRINTEYANRAGSANFSLDSLKWAGREFSDIINQPVRSKDSVTFKGVMSDMVITDTIKSKNYSEGPLGAGLFLGEDENGNTVLSIDKIFARKKLTVYELLIQQLKHQSGMIIYSAASMECKQVEELPNGYKCHMDTKGGQNKNLFVVGDLARCQRFRYGQQNNIEPLKYYWRYVSEVGEDYIVLSKTDCDLGSEIPENGDNIIQLGNRTDKNRMSAKITLVIGNDAPRDEYYQGINEYNLSDKLITIVGIKNGEVGIFTKNGEFSGNIILGPNSSGLENLAEWEEKQKEINSTKAEVNNLGYLKEIFPTSNLIANGAVIGQMVGVMDTSGTTSDAKVIAGLNGTDIGKDSTHGKVIMFGGANGPTSKDIQSALTKIYEDGTIDTSKLIARKGAKFGAFDITINNGKDSISHVDNAANKKTYWSPDEIYFGKANRNIITGKSLLITNNQDINASILTALSRVISSRQDSNVIMSLGANGVSATPDIINENLVGNFVFRCDSGLYAGLRPMARNINGTVTLSPLDYTIHCNGRSTIYMPRYPEHGQRYEILKDASYEMTLHGNGKNIWERGVSAAITNTFGTSFKGRAFIEFNVDNDMWILTFFSM